MIRFSNPNFQSPVAQKAALYAPDVDAWLKLPAQAAQKTFSLAELRAGLPAIAAELTRPVFNQISVTLGLSIDDPSDQTP